MAYMSQENKKRIAAKLKNVVPKNWKYSLRVHNHSTLHMTIRSAPVDLLADLRGKKNRYGDEILAHGEYIEINRHHGLNDWDSTYREEYRKLFRAIYDVLMDGNHDNSDIQTDYFDVGWYAYLSIGEWDKPFKVVA